MWRYLILVLFLGFLGGWFVLRFDPRPVFTEGMVGQPVDLIPGQGPNNSIDQTLERLLFRGLFAYDAAGEIVTDLVDHYETSADGRVYTITLRDAVWRDGRSVSSADVAFTFTRDPAFSDVVIKQEGERQISFVLKEPLAPFLSVLTRPVAPANFRNLRLELLGDSDFAIEAVSQEGETVKELRLKNNGGGRIRTLRFRFYQKEQDLLRAAANGEVDALSQPPASDSYFVLNQVPMFDQYFALFFNLEGDNRLAQNKSFRKAASTKIPPSVGGTVVDGPFSGTWAEGKFDFPRFSTKSVGKFSGSISITTAGSNGFSELAEAIASSWSSSLGITANVRLVDPAEIDGILARRDFDAIILGQTVTRDPDRYNLWHSSQKDFPGQNISGYADPRADRALEEGRRISKSATRQTHYANFQRLFFENNPAILLYHPNFSYWVNGKFTGVDLTPVFAPEERFWNFGSWGLSSEAF